MAYGNWDFGFGEFTMGMDWWCFMGYPCRWVGSHHAMGFGCSYSGVDTEGVEVKIPFDKRPKTRVQGVVDLCFMWGCGSPLPSSGSVLPGWWCAWSWGWVSSDSYCLPLSDGVYLLRAWGWGHAPAGSWDCGLLVDDWASGVSILIIDEGESDR